MSKIIFFVTFKILTLAALSSVAGEQVELLEENQLKQLQKRSIFVGNYEELMNEFRKQKEVCYKKQEKLLDFAEAALNAKRGGNWDVEWLKKIAATGERKLIENMFNDTVGYMDECKQIFWLLNAAKWGAFSQSDGQHLVEVEAEREQILEWVNDKMKRVNPAMEKAAGEALDLVAKIEEES